MRRITVEQEVFAVHLIFCVFENFLLIAKIDPANISFFRLLFYTLVARKAKICFRKFLSQTKMQRLCVQKFPVLQ